MSSLPNDIVSALSLPTPPFPNPNTRRNRVPGRAELLSLQAFAESNARIARVLDEEIEHLKRSHSSIQARYVDLKMEMEATQSELHKANDLLVAVQRQRAALQVEQDDLCALMHPIRRCPDDILRQIFEFTVLGMGRSNSAKMNQAICCSTVCQRWRDVALNTPGLWSSITFILSRPTKNQKILRTCILPRLKHVVTNVSVRTINSNALLDLSRCGLQDIPVVGTLQLKVSTPGETQNLFGPSFNPPTGTTKALEIHCMTSLADPDTQSDAPVLDVLRLAERSPPFSKLLTSGLPSVTFPIGVTNFNITELDVSDLAQLDIRRQYTVDAYYLSDQAHLPAQYNWRKLDGKHKLPQLTCLAHNREPREAFHIFLSRHKSIIELESPLHGNEINLATVAPQLEKITIGPPLESFYRSLNGSSQMPFPSLESLTIKAYDPPNNLTLADFEALVCALCLRMRHPKSQATQSLSVVSTFAIVTTDLADAALYLEWQESNLYKESTKKVDDTDPKKVYLSWPEWD